MNSLLNKLSFSVFSLLCFSALHADNAQKAPQQSPSSQPSSTAPKIFDPNGLKDDCHIWIDADLLFWQSNMGQLNLGTTSRSATSLDHAVVENLDFKWDWGFRLGAGYKLPHDHWDIFLNYTFLDAFAEKKKHAPTGGALFPTWIVPFGLPDGYFTVVGEARWSAHLNIADAELGRTCFVSKWLSIRPFMGVRTAFIGQKMRVKYQGEQQFQWEILISLISATVSGVWGLD